MRKDKKSQYQLKKEKLHCIKYIIKEQITPIDYITKEKAINILREIWELVKDE